MYRIESIDDLSSLSEQVRALAEQRANHDPDLKVYRLVDDESAEQRTVLAPAQSDARIEAHVSSFGSWAKGYQHVEAIGDDTSVTEISVVERLDIGP